MSANLSRLFIFPITIGQVSVNGPGVSETVLVLFGSMQPSGPSGGFVSGGYLDLAEFPWSSGSMILAVQDLA